MRTTDSIIGKRQGRTCFAGTRVTVDILFDHLAEGGTVDSFLEDYDHVSREQVVATIKRAGCVMVARGHARKKYLRRRREALHSPRIEDRTRHRQRIASIGR